KESWEISNIKRSFMITTGKRSRSLGINILGKLVICGFYKTKRFDIIGGFSGIKSFFPASLIGMNDVL
ncbi:MAG TPA: hypothetical protein PK048_03225, partial [Candidatus Absconditabacterales bacterium]|nr:hypothetical protein [Candidatus Absconditabacterales bacterium]